MRTPMVVLLLASLAACTHATRPTTTTIIGSPTPYPPPAAAAVVAPRGVPFDRIAIVGASVSAGLGGLSFRDAFSAAAPDAVVETEADLMMFRHADEGIPAQLAAATAFHATVIVGLDLLFWTSYGPPLLRYSNAQFARHAPKLDANGKPIDRTRLGRALAALEEARAAGAWLVIGDIPRITTAQPWMLDPELVPTIEDLAADNAKIAAWAAGRDRVILVPFAAWTEPLATRGEVALSPTEHVPATDLLSLDGLHPNSVGTWWLLDRTDHLIEQRVPGTPRAALAFARP